MLQNRRTAIKTSIAVAAVGLSDDLLGQSSASTKTGLGLCQYCGNFARKQARMRDPQFDLYQAENFFRFARELGAGGYQVDLGIVDERRAAALREQAAEAGLYIEGMVKAPKTRGDLDRFDAEMRSAAAVGAKAVRSTIFTGRRYEFFDSIQQYREHDKQAMRTLELVAPIAERHRVAFAPENHKDHRIAERVAALQKIDSEFVGACVDTGNNFALLEDPLETAKALAPWAHAVHLKDQAVQSTSSGFLFGDIPLGQGFIDLKKIVAVLQAARPQIHFTLELLTRDPLNVPCLQPKYWTTFPDLPAYELARTLRTVRDHESKQLQYPSSLTLAQQVALEEANVRQSIAYAGDVLGL
jgi:sugar phosphate isomerase/epimerase